MSLRTEGFRLVFRYGHTFMWIHPLEVQKTDVDCTDMSDEEYTAFVRKVCEK